MVCVIAGIKRSASTAQYNLVRLALEMAGYDVTIFGHNYNPSKPPEENEVHLCKRHPFDKELAEKADHIFLTDRNDEDILKSLDRMWGSGDPVRLEGMRKDLEAWKEHADEDHYFEYDFIVNAPDQFAGKIIDLLGVDVDLVDLMEEFNKIEPPEEKYDPVTLLFPSHISDV